MEAHSKAGPNTKLELLSAKNFEIKSFKFFDPSDYLNFEMLRCAEKCDVNDNVAQQHTYL